MDPEINGLVEQFKSIKKHILSVYKEGYSRSVSSEIIDEIIKGYEDALMHFEFIRQKHKFVTIFLRSSQSIAKKDLEISFSIESIFRGIDMECDKALGVLEAINIPLPKEELDKLSSLREELLKFSENLPEISFEKNMAESIKEYENKHYLASALISSRVIVGTLEKIPGENDEERIKFLQEKGFIKEKELDSKKSLTKAIREARNMFSHNISIFPNPSDSITLLGDSVKLLNILSKMK